MVIVELVTPSKSISVLIIQAIAYICIALGTFAYLMFPLLSIIIDLVFVIFPKWRH